MSKELALRPALPWRQQLYDFLYKWGMLLTVAALIALFGLASDNFLDANNIINILRSIAIVTVIAIGVSISLSVGGFDLSVGSTASLANALVISLFVWHGFGTTGAIVVTLLLCTLVGLFNAPADRGVQNSRYAGDAGQPVRDPGRGDDLQLRRLHHPKHGAAEWRHGGRPDPGGVFPPSARVPVIVLIMLAVTVAVQLFLSLTKHGRRMYAIGGNPRSRASVGHPHRALQGCRLRYFLLAGGAWRHFAGVTYRLFAGQRRRRLSDGRGGGGLYRLLAGRGR